jgi:hypothetical protein
MAIPLKNECIKDAAFEEDPLVEAATLGVLAAPTSETAGWPSTTDSRGC